MNSRHKYDLLGENGRIEIVAAGEKSGTGQRGARVHQGDWPAEVESELFLKMKKYIFVKA